MNQYEKIYAMVQRIPEGKVATYGDIAALVGIPHGARQVGYALHALMPTNNVPWQRVINAQGGISLGRAYPGGELQQRRLLEAEGVEFNANGKVNLKLFRWQALI